MAYVYSTSSHSYDFLLESGRTVTINGGANVANKYLLLREGIATNIPDSDLAELQKDTCFLRFVNSGYMSFSKFEKNADTVAKDMESKDESAQATESDFGNDKKASKIKGK
jgi:hypothetical protein